MQSIGIADKQTLDSVKSDIITIKDDLAQVKSDMATLGIPRFLKLSNNLKHTLCTTERSFSASASGHDMVVGKIILPYSGVIKVTFDGKSSDASAVKLSISTNLNFYDLSLGSLTNEVPNVDAILDGYTITDGYIGTASGMASNTYRTATCNPIMVKAGIPLIFFLTGTNSGKTYYCKNIKIHYDIVSDAMVE